MIQYQFNGQTHVMSLEEFVSVNTTGACSFSDYSRTPSIPHRDQLVESIIVAEQRPAKVKFRARPSEEDAALFVKYWLKVHLFHPTEQGLARCGKVVDKMLPDNAWIRIRNKRPDRTCANCAKGV